MNSYFGNSYCECAGLCNHFFIKVKILRMLRFLNQNKKNQERRTCHILFFPQTLKAIREQKGKRKPSKLKDRKERQEV
jgi:hypothetical protein